MSSREITVNTDGDIIVYDGRIIEIFFLDGSNRFLASRLNYVKGDPDATGAVVVQLWATAAQMVGMVRVEEQHVTEVDQLFASIAAPKP